MGTPAYEKDNPITRIARQVADHNAGAGMMRSYGPQVRVESAAMHQPVELPPGEQARLDALAAQHGVPMSDLGEAEEAQHRGPSLAETARLSFGAYAPVAPPRLPDFTKIEGIDLKRGEVIVDGLRFPVPADDLRDMWGYAMVIVKEAVMAQFERALAQVTKIAEVPDDTRQDVPEVLARDTTGQPGEVHPVRESAEESVEAREPGTGEGDPQSSE